MIPLFDLIDVNLLFGDALEFALVGIFDVGLCCTVLTLSGGQSGLMSDSGTGTILDAATNGLPWRAC